MRAGLVVGSVTTSEYPVLYVFFYFYLRQAFLLLSFLIKIMAEQVYHDNMTLRD